jgi:phosphatidate cytidylyltransferase
MLALIGVLWLDEWVDARRIPQSWEAWYPGESGSWPAGTVILLIGMLIVPLAARELARIFHAGGVQASRRWLAMAAMAGLLVSASVPRYASAIDAVAMVATVGTAVLIASLLWHIRGRHLQGATAAVGAALFAFIYLGLMFGFVLALRRSHSAWVVLAVLVITKSCDVGAYATGRLLGRHKLIPWVSPGKTWEGLVGGLCLSAGIAMLAAWLAHGAADDIRFQGVARITFPRAAAMGVLFGLTGQAGDLLASVLKRDARIKDSGQTLPGFGGVLDVVDSVLLVAPVAFWLLRDY